MLGIVNKESFEAFHAKLCLVKRDLKSMPSIMGRVKTTNSRTQVLLKEEIMELTLQVEAGTTVLPNNSLLNSKSTRITTCISDHRRYHHLGWRLFVEQTS